MIDQFEWNYNVHDFAVNYSFENGTIDSCFSIRVWEIKTYCDDL